VVTDALSGGALPAIRARGGILGALLGVGLAYYLGARLGLGLSLVERNVTPLWPPTGIALASFLLLGRRMWPAVAVAALAVNLPISTLATATVTAAGNTLAPLVAAVLLERAGFRRQLDRGRDAVNLVFLAALASMLISATIGTSALYVSGIIPSSSVVSAWAVWWTGDAMGVLVVAPFLLCLPLFWERRDWPPARWVELGAILVVVTVVSAWAAFDGLPAMFLALPVVGLAAWRLQLRGAAPAALVTSVLATWAASHDHGAFEGGSLAEQMLTLQVFNACVALTSLVLAALVSERRQAEEALAAAAADLEERVEQRTQDLTTANSRLLQEIHARSLAQERLGTEAAAAGPESQLAETFQRSLLPSRLPEIPGVDLAARYVPATADQQIGGDWYDVLQLPGGRLALAVGDISGRGIQAAAAMGQLRMALRAYALHDPFPVEVLRGVHQLVAELPVPGMATLVYALFDPDTRELWFANAGHPPALVVADGQGHFLLDGLAPPVGVAADDHYAQVRTHLAPGSTLLLYTNGLVARRGVSLQVGLDRLSLVAGSCADAELETLCDEVLAEVAPADGNEDDIALVAMRLLPPFEGPLRLAMPAEPSALAQVRRTLRRWLRDAGVATPDGNEVLIACGEACANVVQHAYDSVPGPLEVTLSLERDVLTATIADRGRWRPPAERGGGWGMSLMEGLMDSVDLTHGEVEGRGGTTVTMRRRVAVSGDRDGQGPGSAG
jgi:serine phosphatase RsbU (regulator of sigma subunit)/anti-sigma regulatory factor (Ser/Thr protein kinase)